MPMSLEGVRAMSPRVASKGIRDGVPSRSNCYSRSGAGRFRVVPLKDKLESYALEDPEVIEAERWSGLEIAPDRPTDDPVQEMVYLSGGHGGDGSGGQEDDE